MCGTKHSKTNNSSVLWYKEHHKESQKSVQGLVRVWRREPPTLILNGDRDELGPGDGMVKDNSEMMSSFVFLEPEVHQKKRRWNQVV